MIAEIPPIKTAVGKLLLNSWAAEYALNIKPTCADRDFLNSALSWAQPQAYYAALFSMRARLAADEVYMADPRAIEKLMVRWAQEGVFGLPMQTNPFADLFNAARYRVTGPEAAMRHVQLTTRVHAFAILNETYIISRIGKPTYRRIIADLPVCMRDGFVGTRTTLILSDD